MATSIENALSCAQRIIIEENDKLRAKNQKLKDKLCKLSESTSTNTLESDQKVLGLKSPVDKYMKEIHQLKADLSEKTNDCDQLKTALSHKTAEYDILYDTTKNILNTYKSFEQSFPKLSHKTAEYDILYNATRNILNTYESFEQSFPKLPHLINGEIIKKIMNNHEYEKLLSYKFFDAKYLFADINEANTYGIKNEIMKHVLDHCLDLNVEVDMGDETFMGSGYLSTRLIHLFCRKSNPELIRYLIDKNIELECPDKDGHYPLDLICEHSTFEMIKYIISKGVNTKSNPKINLIGIIKSRGFIDHKEAELISIIN